jgi:hypothetical protein
MALLWLAGCVTSLRGQAGWQAQWISTMESQSATNSWLAYRKEVDLAAPPSAATARIAVDSKYWVWINEKLVVFEGGLKRGPNPGDTYYDQVDIAPYLKAGRNTVAVLVWYFGKDGFSHKSSGRAGLLFDCQAPGFALLSDKTWKCQALAAYQTAGPPLPNFRLPESSILYDARLDPGFWQGNAFDARAMPGAMELGEAGTYPWNKLVPRAIPQWKDFGLKPYANEAALPAVSTGDTVVCPLPYNAQITPYFKIEAPAGMKITVCTDNYVTYNGGAPNLRAEYITREGVQEYENLGWTNGHKVYYVMPKGVKILSLRYRETGYDTEFAGRFTSSDPFLNQLWEKSRRTLYLTMRDTYMDCPERERAQWTGDAVNESGEAFYALSPSSHALARKWLYELVGWQRADGSLYAPVPAGNWDNELPCQVLASVGYYGLWNYYLHTGDKQTLADLYDGVKRYLDLWEPDGKGTVKFRPGDWTWGDWGEERDLLPMYNLWYYLAIKGMHHAALELGKTEDARRYQTFMTGFTTAFNAQFWTGTAYRDPAYKGKTDDRTQALAVVAGVAGKDKYPALLEVFRAEEHASPYMEKYVFEAMFQMGYEAEALARHRKRFGRMVDAPAFTTLFEGWGIGSEGFGGGTVNHAWSGGGLTVASQYLCGIAPLTPGYATFQIVPQPGDVAQATATVASVKGIIGSSFASEAGRFTLQAAVPAGTTAIVGIPRRGCTRIAVNNKVVWEKEKYAAGKGIAPHPDADERYVKFEVPAGKWSFRATR